MTNDVEDIKKACTEAYAGEAMLSKAHTITLTTKDPALGMRADNIKVSLDGQELNLVQSVDYHLNAESVLPTVTLTLIANFKSGE